jgi:hypothetical protein
LLAWIAKSGLKEGKNSLKFARFGNLANPKGNFSGFSGSLLAYQKLVIFIISLFIKAPGSFPARASHVPWVTFAVVHFNDSAT